MVYILYEISVDFIRVLESLDRRRGWIEKIGAGRSDRPIPIPATKTRLLQTVNFVLNVKAAKENIVVTTDAPLIGTDNLFHKEPGPRWTLRFTVENLTNKVALYNFLSTFSGTHFVAPRTYQATIGYAF